MPVSEMMRAAWDAHQRENRPDFVEIADEVRCARKVHTCDDCDGEITPGQRYSRQVMTVDGDFTVTKRHMPGAHCPAPWRL